MKRWQQLSVSNKIYTVVGVMAFLIVSELFTLLFVMNTLSAVRTLVGGEGYWSKAQKDAVQHLQLYVATQNREHLDEFNHDIKVNAGFNTARIEIAKPNMDMDIVTKGLIAGSIHPDDVQDSVNLFRRFGSVHYVSKIMTYWRQGDEMILELISLSQTIEKQISSGKMAQADIFLFLDQVSEMNHKITEIEYAFSSTLGEASRWLENLLMIVLVAVVLTVGTLSLLLAAYFSRSLTHSLKELNAAAQKVGQGDFTTQVPVRSEDDLGQLATSINQMTQNLQKQTQERKQAEQASHTKNIFLANMSHEIRTPLNAILGFSELLRDPKLAEEDKIQFLNVIKRTGLNLATIINDILDITKIEAEQLEVEKTAFALKPFFDDLQLLLRLRCDEKGIELKFESSGPISETIISDPLRLRQILINIVGNSIKFTDKGEVKVHYKVQDDFLEFRVEDTGIGIPQNQRDILFHPFSQADNSLQKKHGGTGLGLVLSKNLAKLLGGDVKLLESISQKGSAFLIQVAYQPTFVSTAQKETETAQAIANSRIESPDLLGKKILVVEDTLDSQFLLKLYLTKSGAAVDVANNGKEGMDKALAEFYDLILMDMQMPVMDGYSACRNLKERGCRTPIVALTAFSMSGDREKTIQAGCVDYLSKPVDRTRLLNLVHQYVQV